MRHQSSRTETLTTLGYDVNLVGLTEGTGRTLHAHKARGQSLAYDITIDGSGQMRFAATRLIEPGHTIKPPNTQRPYRVTREQQAITTIMYELDTDDDLGAVVQEMERIAND